ncbi:serine hydrolase, partial [Bacillus anthracis]|nr:serine hydrolase [Bacillus anthracis]
IVNRANEKSHRGDMSVSAVNDIYYAAGWSVNSEQTFIEHSGGNPNFSAKVAILPNERTAICLLSNGASTNVNLVLQVKNILNGNLSQSYET